MLKGLFSHLIKSLKSLSSSEIVEFGKFHRTASGMKEYF